MIPMRTIRTLLVAAGFLGVILSCRKTAVPEAGPVPAEKTYTVSLHVGGAATLPTKLSGIYSPDESRIERWAYWVFDEAGWAIKCGTGDNSLQKDVTLLTGRYTVVVLANYPTSGIGSVPLNAGITQEALLGHTSELTSNSGNCFVMEGEKTVNITEDAISPIEVKVARLVSKVGVRKISVNYTNTRLNNKTTTLKGIYLTNLYRTSRYGSDYAESELDATQSRWYNSMGWHRWSAEQISSGMDALVGESGLSIPISPASPHTQEHYFYCYPNPSRPENDTHDTTTWSVRSTRLVIETDVDGKTFYYQVQLPAMRRNTPYVASEVVIRDLGSTDPEAFIPGTLDVILSTDILGWEGSYSIDEES